jgi:hypothetical protein
MDITCKKVRGGWSATATKNGDYLCTRSGFKTQSRAVRACAAAGREKMQFAGLLPAQAPALNSARA